MGQTVIEKIEEVVKVETSKESIKRRLNWNDITKAGKIVRNVSGVISGLCYSLMKMPIKLPESVDEWLGWISGITLFIAGSASLGKGKK